MPKFKVSYSYKEGSDHHHHNYMDPDAMYTVKKTMEIEAENKEEAKTKFRKIKPYEHVSIDDVSEI